ncbi:MAG: tRNA lysidine(34) synthetase TilS, partial [Gemmatimonadetes bacterium]|nr:tRNA lysidine(34) synthetase TilS [Gemmatimonadota bacterium]
MRSGLPGPAEGVVGAPILDSVLSTLAEAPWEARREPIVVAVSGGLDSMCLLHLLRFYSSIGTGRIHVAHFDHRMRPESGEDARWLAGVTRAWELPIHRGEATVSLTTEAKAREARYAFLAEVKASVSAGAVLTGHTADDQAETVLFRAVRGSGPDGLVGIRPAREDGVERPLLRVWRTDIETYAMRVG